MIVGNPLAAAETLTLMIAMALMFVGLLRIALSLSTHVSTLGVAAAQRHHFGGAGRHDPARLAGDRSAG